MARERPNRALARSSRKPAALAGIGAAMVIAATAHIILPNRLVISSASLRENN